MSLKVWLPLDGNVYNQGCSNITVTNNGATINTSGKIGSCYAFNGSTGYIALSGNDIFNIFTGGTQQFSIAMWIFHADATRAILFGDYGTTGGINFNMELSTGHAVRFYWNGSPDTYPSNATIAANTWSHIALTYDGTKIQSYVNGTAKGSWTGTLAAKNKTSGEFRLGRDTRSDSTAFNGRMNDFRLYDHCLSAAEVKEISQGLILHYKLDGAYGGSHPNLVPCGDTYTKASPRTVTSNRTDGASWVPNSAFEAKPSTTYTISVECDGTLSNQHGNGGMTPEQKPWSFWLYICNVDTTKNWSGGAYDSPVNLNCTNYNYRKIGNAHVWTYTLSSTQKYISLRTNNYSDGSTDLTINYWNMKVEEGNTYTSWVPSIMGNLTQIQDSSGYGYNGSVYGTIALSSDTPRYSMSTIFNGSNTRIQVPNLSPAELTVSFWMKRGANTGTRQFMYTAWSGITCELQTNGTPTFAVNRASYPTITGTAITTDSGWVHYCATFDTISGSKLYQNGVLKSSNTNITPIVYSISTNYIGYYNTYYNGQMSDFRIYCTALSADDILTLYHTGARVDNLGGMHTFEFQENGSNKVYKTGITQGQGISEISGFSNLKYDPNIYIEPDGSAWVRIFHHNNPTDNKFASTDTFTTGVYKDENRWFNFDLCNYVNTWEFIIKSRATPDAIEYKYRWIQTKNPLNAAYADVGSAAVTKITTTGYTAYSWGGLYKKVSSTYLCANNGAESNWWGAIGAWSSHNGGIPGWTTVITTGYEDVYLRIDNLTNTPSTLGKSTKNNIWNASNFIET